MTQFDYVASVSHDLESPLNGILGFLELIKLGLQNHRIPEQVMQDLKTVEDISADMLDLINNMLTAARIEAGREPMSPSYISRETLIDRIGALERTFSCKAKSRNIDFKVTVSSLPQFVYWDILNIRYFAINNMVSNALKFVGNGGKVRVAISCDDPEQVEILVADNGPGIPIDERKTVFEKFNQASNNPKGFSGSGFGLFNAAHVIKSHQGSVDVAEGLEGKGVTFSMKIPAVPFKIEDPEIQQIIDSLPPITSVTGDNEAIWHPQLRHGQESPYFS